MIFTIKSLVCACLLAALAGCTSSNLPVVTEQMNGGNRAGLMTVAQLQHGRVLFASRCIECHTLPSLTAHTETQWPHLIKAMSGRANLKPAEREAVLAYVLAARAQSTALD